MIEYFCFNEDEATEGQYVDFHTEQSNVTYFG